MNKKFCTDMAQGQRLIAYGLDPNTADLYITPKIGGYVVSSERSENSKPAWSLAALINMMPVISVETVGKRKNRAGVIVTQQKLIVASKKSVEKNLPTYWPQMYHGVSKSGYGYGNSKEVLTWVDGPVIMDCFESSLYDNFWVNSAVDLLCWCLEYVSGAKGGEL